MHTKDWNALPQKLRTEYALSHPGDLEKLKDLDAKAKTPARVFGWLYGTTSALVLGTGMSITMTKLGACLGLAEHLPVGIAIGLVGLVMAATTYPIYCRIRNHQRNRYAGEILALCEKISEESDADGEIQTNS